MNKRKSMSRYAFLLLGIVIMSEPVLSYGYTIKQPVESELSAYGNALEVQTRMQQWKLPRGNWFHGRFIL